LIVVAMVIAIVVVVVVCGEARLEGGTGGREAEEGWGVWWFGYAVLCLRIFSV
jgi:hypothetical protein